MTKSWYPLTAHIIFMTLKHHLSMQILAWHKILLMVMQNWTNDVGVSILSTNKKLIFWAPDLCHSSVRHEILNLTLNLSQYSCVGLTMHFWQFATWHTDTVPYRAKPHKHHIYIFANIVFTLKLIHLLSTVIKYHLMSRAGLNIFLFFG